MIALCKKDDIGLYHSFRKGIKYSGDDLEYYIQIKDDNGEYYYFNDERFDEYFDDILKLRKIKLQKIYASSL